MTVMKFNKFAMISVLGLSLLDGAHAATAPRDDGAGPHPRVRRFLQNHPMLRQRLVEKFDANKDGKLDEQERAAAKAFVKDRLLQRKAQIIERFDTNHDGQLSPDERAAARETIRARQAQRRANVLE